MAHLVSANDLLNTMGIEQQQGGAGATGGAQSSAASDPTAAAAAAAADVDEGGPIDEYELRELFDEVRPIRPLSSGHSAPIPLRSLNSELTCPVCLGIIRDTTAVMECLHRFCQTCIEKSLRYGKKECPSCRVSVPSRRNLRKDASFDGVIRAIYPDVEKAESQQESYIAEVIKSANVKNFGAIATKGARQQRDQARRSSKRPASPPPSGGLPAQQPLAKRPRNPNKPEPISFSIVQHPALANHPVYGARFLLRNKFVRTSRYITVLLLKKWLQLKLLNDNNNNKQETNDAKKEEEERKDGQPAVDTEMKTDATASSSSVPTSSPTPAVSNVRFVLYVRAFDTGLLGPDGPATSASLSSSSSILPPPIGTETYVPLASDLTLDHIEEHMWNSAAKQVKDLDAHITDTLVTNPQADTTPFLQAAFKHAFTHCLTHAKQHAKCPEDCTERMAAWHQFLTTESKKYKEQAARVAAEKKAKKEAVEAAAMQKDGQVANIGNATDATMTPADASAVAGDATSVAPPAPTAPAAAAAAASSSSTAPTSTVTPASSSAASQSQSQSQSSSLPPVKKRRLVLYYSIVGADGQLLLDTPPMEAHIAKKYVINRQGDEEAEEEEEEKKEDTTQQPTATQPAVQPTTGQQSGPTQMDIDTEAPDTVTRPTPPTAF